MAITVSGSSFGGQIVINNQMVFDGSLPPSVSFRNPHAGDKIIHVDRDKPGNVYNESDKRTLARGNPAEREYEYEYVKKSRLSTLPDYGGSPSRLVLNTLWDEARKREKPIADYDVISEKYDDDVDYLNLTKYGKTPVDYCGVDKNNASPFQVGDGVVVAFKNQDIAQPVVVGFKNNPVGCFYEFKILRYDSSGVETEMTEAFFVQIRAYSEDWDSLWPEYEYNNDSKYWEVRIDDLPEAGAFFTFWPNDCLKVQYAAGGTGKWNDSEWGNPDDLIKLNRYTVRVPYFTSELYWEPELGGEDFFLVSGYTYYASIEFKRVLDINCAVPYKINYKINFNGYGSYCISTAHGEVDFCSGEASSVDELSAEFTGENSHYFLITPNGGLFIEITLLEIDIILDF